MLESNRSNNQDGSTAMRDGIDARQRKRIRQVGTQATLYVVAAFVTYLPMAIADFVLVTFFDIYISQQDKIYGTFDLSLYM